MEVGRGCGGNGETEGETFIGWWVGDEGRGDGNRVGGGRGDGNRVGGGG